MAAALSRTLSTGSIPHSNGSARADVPYHRPMCRCPFHRSHDRMRCVPCRHHALAAVHPHGLACLRTDMAETTRLQDCRQAVASLMERGAAASAGAAGPAVAAGRPAQGGTAAGGGTQPGGFPGVPVAPAGPPFNRLMENQLEASPPTRLELTAACSLGHAAYHFVQARLGLHPQPLAPPAAAARPSEVLCLSSDGHVGIVAPLAGGSADALRALRRMQQQLGAAPASALAGLGFAGGRWRTLDARWGLKVPRGGDATGEGEGDELLPLRGAQGTAAQPEGTMILNADALLKLAATASQPGKSGTRPVPVGAVAGIDVPLSALAMLEASLCACT